MGDPVSKIHTYNLPPSHPPPSPTFPLALYTITIGVLRYWTRHFDIKLIRHIGYLSSVMEAWSPVMCVYLRNKVDRRSAFYELTAISGGYGRTDGQVKSIGCFAPTKTVFSSMKALYKLEVMFKQFLFSFQFNFVGRILGPRGLTAKQLEQETGCKVMVRGKGSMRDKKKVSHTSLFIYRYQENLFLAICTFSSFF